MHTCICNLDCFGSQYLCMHLAGSANSIHMFECGPYSRSGETPLLVIWSPVSPVAPCNFFHLIAFSQSPVFRDWTYLLRMCNFQLLFLHIRGSSARIPERFPYRAGLPHAFNNMCGATHIFSTGLHISNGVSCFNQITVTLTKITKKCIMITHWYLNDRTDHQVWLFREACLLHKT